VFKQGFIVTRDSKLDDETRLSYESYDDLRTIINAMPARHILLVVDACFSGTFDRRIGEASSRGIESYANFPLPELYANKARLPTRKYLTSGGKEYVPDGPAGKHSNFAGQFLQALRTYGGQQGYLTFSAILNGVENTKPQPYWGEWGDNEPGSDFFFISKRLIEILKQPAASSAAAAPAQEEGIPPASKDRLSIAVLGFKSFSGVAQDRALCSAVAEGVATEVSANEKIRGIPGEEVSRAKSDLKLENAAGFAKDTLERLHRVLGVKYILSGSCAIAPGGSMRIDLRLQDAVTGEMVAQAGQTGSDLSEIAKGAAVALHSKLGITSRAAVEQEAIASPLPAGREATRFYGEGIEKLRAYDLLGARDFLQRAVSADPKFALAHEALARTWTALGYDAKAKEEAAAANDLARTLPFEFRTRIEATYRETAADWDRASKLYNLLWTAFPDEPEYALRLAEIQITSGNARDALATLKTALGASTRAAQDPRIYVQQAIAAGSLSDAKRQEAAASKAIATAEAVGAKSLVALGYWQQCSALLSLGSQQEAQKACNQASSAADSAADQQVRARSITLLANLEESQGRTSDAMEHRKEALGIARRIGSQKDIIGALINLSALQAAQGSLDEATSGYEEAKRIAEEINDREQRPLAELDYAGILFTRGMYQQAREVYTSLFNTASQAGDTAHAIAALQNAAIVSFEIGEVARALSEIQRAKTLARTANLEEFEALCGTTLADILRARADVSGARKEYDEALTVFTKAGDQQSVALTRLSVASLLLDTGNPKESESLARQAAEEFQKENLRDQEATAHATLARALAIEEKMDEALEEIDRARALSPADWTIRMSIALDSAFVYSRARKWPEAEKILDEHLLQAEKLKLRRYALEIKLTKAEIEHDQNPKAAQPFADLQRDATTSGYLLVAKRASRDGKL
jgi:eukaryotic-like serine/threonine-protein kinase